MAKRSKTAKADIKIRLTEGLRSKVERAAKEAGVSMNAEMIARLDRSFEWDQARGTVKEWIAESEAVLQRGFEAALQHHGYQRIGLDQGTVWAEPGMNASRMSVSIDAAAIVSAMQPRLIEVLASAIAEVAKKEKRS